jgi:hypothetical protein
MHLRLNILIRKEKLNSIAKDNSQDLEGKCQCRVYTMKWFNIVLTPYSVGTYGHHAFSKLDPISTQARML